MPVMPGRCQCAGCASGQNGGYSQLVHTAQADDDIAHRQLAMSAIADIAPMAGTAEADALAVLVLDLYYGDEAKPHTEIF